MSRSTGRKIHASPPAGYGNGDTVNGRSYVLHPTKGWRNLRAADTREISAQSEARFHPLVQLFRLWARKKGIQS